MLFITAAPTISALDAAVDNVCYNIVFNEDYPQTPSVEVTFDPVRNSARQGTYSGAVNIPESVTIDDVSYLVIGIGEEAFRYSQDLTSINYPSSITYIGQNAFRGCDNVPLFEIYEYNDQGDLVANPIYIPEKVYVADSAFCESGLERLSFNGRFSTSTDGAAVFKDCKKLKKISISTDVPSECFSGCDMLEDVYLSEKCTYIGRRAFAGCKSITTDIYDNIFVNHLNLRYGLRGIGEYAFEGCTGLKTINIPASVQTIDQYAFKDCSSLTDVYFLGCELISSGEDKLADNDLLLEDQKTIFEGCNSIVNGFNGRRVVSDYEGTLCDPFKGLNLKYIRFEGFCIETPFDGYDYPDLQEISCGTAIPPKGVRFTENQYKNVHLYIPRAFENAYNTTQPWSSFLSRGATGTSDPIIIEHNGLYYAAKEYYNEVSIVADPYGEKYSGDKIAEDFVIGENQYKPTKVAANAFADCKGLTSIRLPSSISSIGHSAFTCSGIKSIDLSQSESLEMEIGAFDSCEDLVEVKLPKNCPIFPKYAFNNCIKLSKINFPENGYAEFCQHSFEDCISLPDKIDFSNLEYTVFHESSFVSCGISEIELPKSANFPADEFYPAFAENPLKVITVHNAEVGTAIFSNSNVMEKAEIDRLIVKGDVTVDFGVGNNCWLTDGKVKRVILDLSEISYPVAYWLDKDWNIDEIESMQTNPPAIGVFSDEQYKTIKVYVPQGCVEAYKASSDWKNFLQIEEIGSAGIDDIKAGGTIFLTVDGGICLVNAENETYNVYTATGQLVANGQSHSEKHIITVAPGYYIIKCGNKVSKVVVK